MLRPFSSRPLVPFAVIVLVAACSSNDGASDGTTAPESERTAATLQAEIESAADALIDQWGSDRDAFFGVVWSLDAGYSAAQIIAAAADERMRVDGAIAGSNGGVLEPEYEPTGLLELPEIDAARFGPVVAVAAPGIRSALGRLADDTPSNAKVTGLGLLQEAFDGGLAAFERSEEQAVLDRLDRQVTFLVLDLALRGYSTQQILEGLMVGSIIVHVEDDIKCVYVATTDRTTVRPVRPPADIFIELACPAVPEDAPTEVAGATTTTTTTEAGASTTTTSTTTTVPEALQLPATYEGSSEQRLSWSNAKGMCTINTTTMRVTLHPDGTVTGTVTGTETFHTTTDNDANNVTTVICLEPSANPYSFEVTGTHTAQYVTLGTVEVQPWVQGPFTSETMTLTYTAVSELGLLGDQTYEAEFNLTPIQD